MALAECAVVWAARGVDKLYAADPYWLVASYAEPWRTVAMCAIVVLPVVVSVRVARTRSQLSWPRSFAAAATMILGFAICLELTTAVHFNDALGELYVHTLVFRRAKVSIDKGDGACLRADVDSPFVWRLNGTSIHPRLLPLPYESRTVVSRLLGLSSLCVLRR